MFESFRICLHHVYLEEKEIDLTMIDQKATKFSLVKETWDKFESSEIYGLYIRYQGSYYEQVIQ